jgi:hypothetical protein
MPAVFLFPGDFLSLEGDRFDFIRFDQFQKLGVAQGGLGFGLLGGVEVIEQKNHYQADEQPQGNVFIERTEAIIHMDILGLGI